MTKKNRVEIALSHIAPDRTPYNIELTSEAMKRFSAYSGIAAQEYFDSTGNHIEKCSYNTGTYIKPGYYQDEFGVLWNRSGADKDIGVVERYIFPDADLGAYRFPVPDLEAVDRATARMVQNGRDTMKLGKIGMLFFERAWSLRGMENLMCDFYLNEEFAMSLFDKILEYNLEIVNGALKFDIDGFYFGDDYGMQTGLIFSPEVFRKYIKPRLKTLFEPIQAKKKKVMLHSCGNIEQILPDLIELGLDVYQTVQPELYDLKKLKNQFGKDLTFWGGISTQRDLPYLAPSEIVEIVKRTIDILGENGGYICGPTHQVPADVPPENIAAMIEVLQII
jgi:uroporphyrinogen decarboxylase